jgi:hypothetical protein
MPLTGTAKGRAGYEPLDFHPHNGLIAHRGRKLVRSAG